MQSLETLADGGIEGCIGGEPALGSSLAPKGDDLIRFNGISFSGA